MRANDGAELAEVLGGNDDEVSHAFVRVLTCLYGRVDAAMDGWWAASGGVAGASAARGAPPPAQQLLLRRARAALARLADEAQYVAHDGSALRDALAAELRAAHAPAACAAASAGAITTDGAARAPPPAKPRGLPRWALRRRAARTAVVALTPAPLPGGAAAAAPELFTSTIVLTQHAHAAPFVSSPSSARGDREAAAACGALLRARAEALRRRRLASPHAVAARVWAEDAERRSGCASCRAFGGVLSSDGAWLRLGVAAAPLGGAGAPAAPTLTWSRPLRLAPWPCGGAARPHGRAPDGAGRYDLDEAPKGARVLANLLRQQPAQLGQQLRVHELLARIAAFEAATPPDEAPLLRAVDDALRAEEHARAVADAAAAAAAADDDSSSGAQALATATRSLQRDARKARLDAEIALLGAKNAGRGARMTYVSDLDDLWAAAALQLDAPAGAGNHSAVYALRRWPPDGNNEPGGAEGAAAKVACASDAQLAEEAALLSAMHAAPEQAPPCAALPRLLYTSAGAMRPSRSWGLDEQSRAAAAAVPTGLPAFIVIAPLGAPLADVLRRLPRGAAAAAARRALADGVAEGLLAALRAAHARGVTHGNMKIDNVVLTPPPPPLPEQQGGGEEEDAAALADALVSGAWRPRGVLIDWGTARALGMSGGVRPQRGYEADATETLQFTSCPFAGARWLLTPRQDLESVAYLYASIAHPDGACGGGLSASASASASVSDALSDDLRRALQRIESTRPPWMLASRSSGNCSDGDGNGDDGGGDAAARADTGLHWVGPVAAARAAWLRAHPDALGERGRRFLAHVRAGRDVYSFDISDEEHAALMEGPGGGAPLPLRARGGCYDEREYDNGPRTAAEKARQYAAAQQLQQQQHDDAGGAD
jgi:hypothetical protein